MYILKKFKKNSKK